MQKIQEFIGEHLTEQKNNLFLWAPFCFAFGIAIYFGLKFEPPLALGVALCLITLSLVGFLFKKQEESAVKKLGFLLSIGAGLMALGFSIAQIRSHIAYTPMIVKKMAPVDVIGTIKSLEPLGGKDGSRVILTKLEIERLKSEQTPQKIRIKIRKDDDLKTGQRIKMLAGLNPASPPVAPHAFDFQRMAYFESIGAVGFSYNAPEILEKARSKQGSWLASIRTKIVERVSQTTQQP